MKKLTFFAAAFLVAATSFAQTAPSGGTPEAKQKSTHGTTVSTTAKATVSADGTTDAAGKGELVREVAKAKADKTKAKKEEANTLLKEEAAARKDAAKARKEDTKGQREERKEATKQAKTELKVKTKAEVEAATPAHDNHGAAVSTVATRKEKGTSLKATASEKRQRAGRVETDNSSNPKAGSSSARRAKANKGLSTRGVNPVKVNTGVNLKVHRK